jgi:hypothetical protein
MTAIETESFPVLSDAEMAVRLLGKIAAAQESIETIDKDSENKFHHYNYASIEAIVKGTREHLLSHGLVVLAGQTSLADEERDTNQGRSAVTTVRLNFRIYDVETGYAIELPWSGRGDDPADKGISKALTDARKSFLIQQFNLARGDDTEADSGTDERSSGSGYVARGSATANMIADAKGLSDEQLNRSLVAVGLPAAKQPFGMFARVPNENADALRQELLKLRG